ncbi:DUF2298 domain-containing protein [Halobacteriales archaeon Cl-PHB]
MESLVVLQWVLALAVLTGVGAPLAAVAFGRFPGRGAAFALPAALVPVAVVTFWVGQVTFGGHTVLLAVALTGLASLLARRRGHRPDWSAVVRAFGVFLVGFGFLLSVRLLDPTISYRGGEQFLHFGLVQALERAPSLPPEDFWFAGEPLRYYYGTQLQVTLLSMLSGTPLRFGFNLGVPTFYGVLFTAAYGLAGAVAASRGRSARVGGVLGAVFVAVGGATTTAIRMGFGLLPTEVAVTWGRPAFEFAAARYGIPLTEFVAEQGSPETWSWWYTRYVIPGTIQEFPLYTFVKADLHGHSLSTGYVVVAAALAFAYYRTPGTERWRRRGLLGGLGLLAGVFGFMNTWSLPTAVGLAALAVAAADAHPATLLHEGLAVRLHGPSVPAATDLPDRLRAEGWRLVLAAGVGIAVGLVGVAIASPFLVFGHVPQNEGVGLLPPRTRLAPFLVVYGGLLALLATYLGVQTTATTDLDHWTVGLGALAVGVLAVLAVLLDAQVFAVALPILGVAWWLVRTERAGFAAVLVVAGVGLLLSFEVLFARVADWEKAPRWETAYKVAVQAWTLLGLAAGVAATALLGRVRGRLAAWRSGTSDDDAGESRTLRSTGSALAVGAVVLLVVLASTPFALLVTATEVTDPLTQADAEPSLDALRGYETDHADELAAAQWLSERPGSPTIVEAHGAQYDRRGRVAVLTGLPTLVGWTSHQAKFRGEAAVQRRAAAVDAIYGGSWAAARAVLQRYDVEYVVVGAVERAEYAGLDERFEGRTGLSVAFSEGSVTIYAVDEPALADG